MAYQIIEQSCIGKKDEAHNEDGWIATPDYVAVIDGSTSKGTFDYGDKRSGRLAMEIIREAIKGLRPNCTIRDAANELSAKIDAFYLSHDIVKEVQEHPENRLTASVVIYSVNRQEVWQIGDCPCMIDNAVYENPKYWEQPIAQARALFLEKELSEGKRVQDLQKQDTGREYILPLLRYAIAYQNNESEPLYGYGVIDGFPIANRFLRKFQAAGARQIILSSDGYLHLFPTLAQSEQYNSQLLEEDPLCIRKHKMTKGVMAENVSFDDRTYIRLLIK